MNGSMTGCSLGPKLPQAKSHTILLLDDDERARHPLQFFLECAGYRVIATGSVTSAENYITGRGDSRVSAIISDVYLNPFSKRPDGYELFLRWKAKAPDLVFILISGNPAVCHLPEVRSGKVEFLAKPFNPYDILATVRSLLQERRALDRMANQHDSITINY